MENNTEANENQVEQETVSEESEAVEATEETVEENTEADNGLAEKLEEVKDKLLRKAAEFDNFRKRTAKEKTENFAMGVCEAAEKLLPVLDNLDRAIASAEAEGGDKAALLDGIKMVRKQFGDALGEIGISEIEAVGSEFDPEKHNAVMMEENDSFPSNTVSDELAKGYIYKKGETQRVVRHSIVKVTT